MQILIKQDQGWGLRVCIFNELPRYRLTKQNKVKVPTLLLKTNHLSKYNHVLFLDITKDDKSKLEGWVVVI